MTEEGRQTGDIRERCQKREDRREIDMGHKQKGRNIGKRVGSEDIKGKRQGTATEVKTRRGRDREGDTEKKIHRKKIDKTGKTVRARQRRKDIQPTPRGKRKIEGYIRRESEGEKGRERERMCTYSQL